MIRGERPASATSLSLPSRPMTSVVLISTSRETHLFARARHEETPGGWMISTRRAKSRESPCYVVHIVRRPSRSVTTDNHRYQGILRSHSAHPRRCRGNNGRVIAVARFKRAPAGTCRVYRCRRRRSKRKGACN